MVDIIIYSTLGGLVVGFGVLSWRARRHEDTAVKQIDAPENNTVIMFCIGCGGPLPEPPFIWQNGFYIQNRTPQEGTELQILEYMNSDYSHEWMARLSNAAWVNFRDGDRLCERCLKTALESLQKTKDETLRALLKLKDGK